MGKYHTDPEAAQAKRRDYYAKHAAQVLAVNAKSRAKHPEAVKKSKREWYSKQREIPEFKERIRTRALAFKDQKRVYDIEYRERNAEKLEAIKLKWRRENRDKIRNVQTAYDARRRAQCEGGIGGPALRAWVQEQVLICVYCGSECATDYEVDHIHPLSRGGQHDETNLAIACARCNRRKNSKSLLTFLLERNAAATEMLVAA